MQNRRSYFVHSRKRRRIMPNLNAVELLLKIEKIQAPRVTFLYDTNRTSILRTTRKRLQVKSSPRREELVGGSVVMGEGAASAGGVRGGSKETERQRLARRLRERTNTRRTGGGGAKPNR